MQARVSPQVGVQVPAPREFLTEFRKASKCTPESKSKGKFIREGAAWSPLRDKEQRCLRDTQRDRKTETETMRGTEAKAGVPSVEGIQFMCHY